MPQHRRSERLPQRLIDRVRASDYSEFFGHIHTVPGGGIRGPRYGFLRPILPNGGKPKRGSPMDVQYTLRDHILTRTEFLRGEPSIPVHMAHFDPDSGQRFSTVLDCFS